MSWIRKQILGTERRYFIDQVKRPLRLAIIKIADRYPEPTRQNCTSTNIRILLDIRDRFFEHQSLGTSRGPMWKAAWKILLCEYEHDPYYAQRFDWVLKQLMESRWRFSVKQPIDRSWKKNEKPKEEEIAQQEV